MQVSFLNRQLEQVGHSSALQHSTNARSTKQPVCGAGRGQVIVVSTFWVMFFPFDYDHHHVAGAHMSREDTLYGSSDEVDRAADPIRA
jgi:hypothetical protein